MDIAIQGRPNLYSFPSRSGGRTFHKTVNRKHQNHLVLCKYTPKFSRQRILVVRASSSNPNDSDGFDWVRFSESIRQSSQRLLVSIIESVKKETGFDIEDSLNQTWDTANNNLQIFRTKLLPEFIDWNTWNQWKEIKKWDARRIGALVLYLFVVIFSCRKIYTTVRAPFLIRQQKEINESYFEALIPEPTPANIRKFKEGMWRKTTPKGLKLKKLIEGPDSTLTHDTNYIGETAWDDENVVENIMKNDGSEEQSLVTQENSVENEKMGGTWRERLQKWNEILRKEKLSEDLDSLRAKYVVEFDMKEVEKSLEKEIQDKAKSGSQGTRGLWISKRWWRYRPKLPYTYFLEKLDSSEVAAVVITEDLKRLYVTMKEGFPLEYVVDIPLDPYLFEMISSSGADIDLLQRRQIYYFMKAAIVLGTGIISLYLISNALIFLHMTTRRVRQRMYSRIVDKFTVPNFILPFGQGDTKAMYTDVVLGGDVWDILDELMIYMENPMQFYEKDVQFARGVLLYGPPGTGKTLFARTLSKRCGIPFVYASGAEFSGNTNTGAAKISELFNLAHKNAPAFIFIDEIDAIAGKDARDNSHTEYIFNALIAQLDGQKKYTGVDRSSLNQSVIFICATNRPDDLHPEFLSLGRIDRRLCIGLPDEKQRVQIFAVHSRKRQLAEDVDFGKIVFRTVGYSGADIRNLINDAAIMAVRNQHPKIHQQDIIDVLDKQLLEGMGVLITEEEKERSEQRIPLETKRLIAVHEAGHILLAHVLPQFDSHAFSQLFPGGKETAMSVFYPREDVLERNYTTFAYMKMQMIVAHGGRCAERVVFGDDVTDGGRDDLKKITKIGREMVISPSNERLGLTTLMKRVGFSSTEPPSATGTVIKYKWDDTRMVPVDMSPEVSELFTRELNRYIDETEEIAMDGLKANRHILDSIVEILLEKLTITGLDAEALVKSSSPVMFDNFDMSNNIDVEGEETIPMRRDGMKYKPLDIFPAPLHRC